MTKTEHKEFIRDLLHNVGADLLARVDAVPANWDGHELRQWIADKFQESSYTLKRDRRRYRAYKNDVLMIGRL